MFIIWKKQRTGQAASAPACPVLLWLTLLGRSFICPQHEPCSLIWGICMLGLGGGGKPQHSEESGIFQFNFI